MLSKEGGPGRGHREKAVAAVLNQGQFCHPGHIGQCVETFLVIMTWLWDGDGGLCSCHSVSQDQGCC